MKDKPYAINIDPTFKPVFGSVEIPLEKFTFLGGEPHVRLTQPSFRGKLYITQRYTKVEDIFNIILAADAAQRIGFRDIELILPYFPAARQDRVCNSGEPLTVKVFADMINGCDFEKVHILCPHSEVTPAVINNSVVCDEIAFVQQAIDDMVTRYNTTKFNIVCPDAGAGKRVMKVTQVLQERYPNYEFDLVRCEKVRDIATGKLLEFFVQQVGSDLSRPSIIVDDINSMGGTFIGLGNKLKELGCDKLNLFTTHSDCVDGISNVCKFFDHVYTTASRRDWGDVYDGDNFTCYPIVF